MDNEPFQTLQPRAEQYVVKRKPVPSLSTKHYGDCSNMVTGPLERLTTKETVNNHGDKQHGREALLTGPSPSPPQYMSYNMTMGRIKDTAGTADAFNELNNARSTSTPSSEYMLGGQKATVQGGRLNEMRTTNIKRERPPLAQYPNLHMKPLDVSGRTHSSPAVLLERSGRYPSSDSLPLASPGALFPTQSALTLPTTSEPSKALKLSPTQAMREARHFAGGLISRPVESTKHFSIIRHSLGLVFYKGEATSIAITIFSDEPLAVDRRLFLFKKGTGSRLKGFVGATKSWIDVTPTLQVTAEQLKVSDERAWQRDIEKFKKKGPAKLRMLHVLRETHIVRIPEGAGDGYYQIMLCSGTGRDKKQHCPSPIFRVLSASTNPSSIKGAPLATLPLEIGLKAGSIAAKIYAKNTVGRVTAIARPVASVAVGKATKFVPTSFLKAQITSKARDLATDAAQDANNRFHECRHQPKDAAAHTEVDLISGPQQPYPISFQGFSYPRFTNLPQDLEVAADEFTVGDAMYMPQIDLTDVIDQILKQLSGHYFGWARQLNSAQADAGWCQAIISVTVVDVSLVPRVKIGQGPVKKVQLRLLTDYEDIKINKDKFQVRVLGFIRADEPALEVKQRAAISGSDREAAGEAMNARLFSVINDITIAQEFLDHPSWSAHVCQANASPVDRKASMLSRLASIPVHKVGVRGTTHTEDDGFGGFYVLR